MPIEIKLPSVTPDMETGTIGSWLKGVGDKVEKGEVIVEIETDKALVEVEAEASGTLARIIVGNGVSDVPVLSTIGVLLTEGESTADLDQFVGGVAATPAEEQSVAPDSVVSQAAANTDVPLGESARIFASPLARRIADQQGVDLNTLSGRGPNGRILKADVEAARSTAPAVVPANAPAVAAVAAPSAASSASHEVIPHSSMRKVIAARLLESKQTVPHFYLEVSCEIDRLMALRAELNAEAPEGADSYKLTVNDFVIKAAALAMRDVPEVNASWSDSAVLRYQDVDISVAVSTDEGLITPIVRRADTKGLATLSNQVKELAGRARDGRLKPDEYKGGGFSISNLGMYGVSSFSAIINPPQACILAVGAAEQRPVVRDGALAIATLVNCTLSVDHRVVDGAVGARYLQALKYYLEHPTHLMLRGG
ncbi:MAG TPA: pyruvate dehydrogenase complex dihydrolipoamide acetyltransferase [Motiliproteus sp.]